jgi:hypothetical protein
MIRSSIALFISEAEKEKEKEKENEKEIRKECGRVGMGFSCGVLIGRRRN